MMQHRPVQDIIADRTAAHAASIAAQEEFNKFDAELRAVKATIEQAMRPNQPGIRPA